MPSEVSYFVAANIIRRPAPLRCVTIHNGDAMWQDYSRATLPSGAHNICAQRLIFSPGPLA